MEFWLISQYVYGLSECILGTLSYTTSILFYFFFKNRLLISKLENEAIWVVRRILCNTLSFEKAPVPPKLHNKQTFYRTNNFLSRKLHVLSVG